MSSEITKTSVYGTDRSHLQIMATLGKTKSVLGWEHRVVAVCANFICL